jgi:DNA-binding HxlR family transcriptional regulator
MKKQSKRLSCCPAEDAMVVLGGKWRVGIIHHLQEGATRFNALRQRLPGITQKMLTQQLRHLQRYGIVERRQLERIPPHVEYSLTPLGKKAFPLLKDITKWAKTHMPALEAAAAKHDQTNAKDR